MFAWLREPRSGRCPDATPPTCSIAAQAPGSAIYQRLGIPASLHYPTATLSEMLDQSAERFRDAPAIIYESTCITYGQLHATVNRLAGGMAKLGVRAGDRVLMTLPNCPEYLYGFFATQRLGAVLVNAGPLMGIDDLTKLIAKTTPRLIIAVDLQAPALCAAANGAGPGVDDGVAADPNVGANTDGADELALLWVSLEEYQPVLKRLGYHFKLWQSDQRACRRIKQVTFDALLADAPPCPPTVAPSIDATALLQPTGGTTGTLKVAELTHRNLLANAEQLSTWVPMRPGQERVLAVLPMFHVYGMTTCLTTGIFNGACLYLLTRFRVGQVLDTILQHRPTILPLVPAIIQAICDELGQRPRPQVADAVRNRYVISGAAPLPPATGDRFEQITGMRIVQGYGLTECSPVTHANPPTEPRGGSIGIPLPDTRTRIVDLADPTKDAEEGQPGELWISGPQVMAGYFREPEQTANVITTDAAGRRWLHTGDVARVDSDGYFYILDRKKDMINHGGLKVYPAKVERVIMMHPKVADAAVIGEDDPTYTEAVIAKVVARGDGSDALRAAINTLCREHLAAYEVPHRIDFVKELPRSALGKMLKYTLRQGGGMPAATESASRDGHTKEIS
jgi:long-chain acyl-CoA synthetase